MKHWKVALSFAILGAIAAPFITGSVKSDPWSEKYVPLTPEEKKRFARIIEDTDNCQMPRRMGKDETGPPGFEPVDLEEACYFLQKALNEGGRRERYSSMPKYLALNSAVALAGFGVVFGALMIPALFRRYWRWLNT